MKGLTPNSCSPWAMHVCNYHVPPFLLSFITNDVYGPACFLGALQLVAGKAGKKDAIKDAEIHVQVHLGKPTSMDGFALGVDIKVEGVHDDELLKLAHEVCHNFNNAAVSYNSPLLLADC